MDYRDLELFARMVRGTHDGKWLLIEPKEFDAAERLTEAGLFMRLTSEGKPETACCLSPLGIATIQTLIGVLETAAIEKALVRS